MADIKKLLEQMTIEEKIGQLVQYNANIIMDTSADVTGPRLKSGLSDEQINNIGSVLNFKTPLEVRAIQDKHLENDRLKIPMIFMMDVIHGFRTIFPIPLALGCSFNPDMVGEAMKMSAREAIAGGVQVTFTPMVDYVRDARWGRVMETCGEDVLLNSVMGAAQVKAFQGDGDYANNKEIMATCVKHFAAYGGAEAGRDYAQVELSEHILREFYLPAYKACIDAGTEMLMPSFNVLNGVPAVVNKWLMQKILRDEWNFDGLVISDYNAIGELKRHGITEDMKEAARLAFENGCHIDMCASAYSHNLKALVQEGTIPMEVLDDAVYRVLDLKKRLGLFEDPYRGASTLEEPEEYLTEENRDMARRMAEESAVLLKNDGILPLSADVKKIALIGPMADEHAIIGFWSCNGINEESITIKEGIERLMPNVEITYAKGCGNAWDDYDTSGFAQAKEVAKDADVVILCVGEPQGYAGEGNSRIDITLTGVQSLLAREIAEVNPNVVAVTFSGRPIAISELDADMAAILHMWFPGTEGGNAVANLLFGKANPSGKLSMSFPKAVGQCPIYYNHTNTGRPKSVEKDDVHVGYTSNYIGCGNLPLYSFGHGLSYADFVYEGMELSSDKITADVPVTAKITVRNNSKVDGKETVMLYMRDVYASNSRPVQQMIAFDKVEIAAGETKVIEFVIEEPMLRFWNNENEFVSEPGRFQISTGYADHLILTKDLYLE
ncbi:MAG: beta-glucosidase BglX [Agathobacter sp.]|nr:beta-glucosidase BglX [Agathobacter sp.]